MAESTNASSVQDLIRELGSAISAAREVVHATIELAAVEARRAGSALVVMVVCSMVAVMAIVAGWLGLMGALVMGLVAVGLSAVAAILATVVFNIALAGILIYAAVRLSNRLLFESTRRQIASIRPVSPT